jgi:hypothetical protein
MDRLESLNTMKISRSCLFAALFTLFCVESAAGSWEYFDPEWTSPAEERILLSIGSRREPLTDHPLGPSHFADTVIAGGKSGLLTVSRIEPELVHDPQGGTYWDYTRDWHRVQSDVSFDVSAVTATESNWIIGGPQGRIATHPFVSWEESGPEALVNGWREASIPTTGQVTALSSIKDTVVALAGKILFVSTDSGQFWVKVAGLEDVEDIETHGGHFFAVTRKERTGSPIRPPVPKPVTVRILRSLDGLNWSERWSTEGTDSPGNDPDFFVLSDIRNRFDRPLSQSSRLYLTIPQTKSLIQAPGCRERVFSTIAGDSWTDHTSVDYLPYPSHNGEPVSANLRIGIHEIQQYEASEWETVLNLRPSYYIDNGTVNQWGKLTYAARLNAADVFVSVYPDETQSRIPLERSLPDAMLASPHIIVNGTYFGEYPAHGGNSRIVATTDLLDFEIIDLPEKHSQLQLIAAGKRLGAYYLYTREQREQGRALSLWDGESWTPPVNLPEGTVDVAFQSQTDTWFALVRRPFIERRDPWTEEYSILSFDESGVFSEYATIFPQWATSFDDLNHLSAPDRHVVVAHGEGELIAVLDDGSIEHADLSDYRQDVYEGISDVNYINGWYYLSGLSVLRTQDFKTFEELPLPGDRAAYTVIAFDGDLYAFTSNIEIQRDTVFKRRLERGYLQSVQHTDGWYYSDWLGWFTNPDEATWQVDHLILGKIVVYEVVPNQLGYLDTATLGRLEYHVDWMPWVRRQEDGHWIWIDFDGWPPRVWNADLGQWIDLNP